MENRVHAQYIHLSSSCLTSMLKETIGSATIISILACCLNDENDIELLNTI